MNLWLIPKKKNSDPTKSYSFPVTDENIEQAIAWLDLTPPSKAPQQEHATTSPNTQEPPG